MGKSGTEWSERVVPEEVERAEDGVSAQEQQKMKRGAAFKERG